MESDGVTVNGEPKKSVMLCSKERVREDNILNTIHMGCHWSRSNDEWAFLGPTQQNIIQLIRVGYRNHLHLLYVIKGQILC